MQNAKWTYLEQVTKCGLYIRLLKPRHCFVPRTTKQHPHKSVKFIAPKKLPAIISVLLTFTNKSEFGPVPVIQVHTFFSANK